MNNVYLRQKNLCSPLYHVVFRSKGVKCFVCILFLNLLLQPLTFVFASEVVDVENAEMEAVIDTDEPNEDNAMVDTVVDTALTDSAKSDETETQEEEEEIDAVNESEGQSEEIAEETEFPIEGATVDGEGVNQEVVDTADDTAQQHSEVLETLHSSSSSDAVSTAYADELGVSTTTDAVAPDDVSTSSLPKGTTTESVIESNATTTQTTPTTTSSSTGSVAEDSGVSSTTTEDSLDSTEQVDTDQPTDPVTTPEAPKIPIADESHSEEHATSTSHAPQEENVFVMSYTNDQNRHQFAESECVSVGGGAFYCSKKAGANMREHDGVYVEIDEDGDREIFLREHGVVTQITDNTYEDGAPSYDKKNGQIVFHRLIEGRYQIMRYDIETGIEEQLTASHENNMEPTQGGGVVVWQRWIVDNWEIALLEDDEIKIITDNTHHDIAPTIRDGYVMWHTTNTGGDKLLSVYDIKNEVSSTIADPDGGHVENPRFILVYDTVFENGDTITKEYDPATGNIQPIGSTSHPTPREIPPPDSTGEVRALIGIKNTPREGEVEEVGEATPPDHKATSTISGTSVSSSTSRSGTSTTPLVDIPDVNLATSTDDVLPLTDFDIIVLPYGTTTAIEESSTMIATSSESEA